MPMGSETDDKSQKRFILIFAVTLLLLPLITFFGLAPVDMGSKSIGAAVNGYREFVTVEADKYGMSSYIPLILAVMQQESAGEGNDPMQAAEGPFNTEYPKQPNGITDPLYSIDCGIQELKQNLDAAQCLSPADTPGIELALQGYNFGTDFITWAKDKGGYTPANAQEFSQIEAQKMGWSKYGDVDYVSHVLRYYQMFDISGQTNQSGSASHS